MLLYYWLDFIFVTWCGFRCLLFSPIFKLPVFLFQISSMWYHLYIYAYIYMYICIHMCVYIHVYIYVYIYKYMFPFSNALVTSGWFLAYNNFISLRTVPTSREGSLQTICMILSLCQNTWSGCPVIFSLCEWACVGVLKWHKAVRKSSSTTFCAGKRKWTLRSRDGGKAWLVFLVTFLFPKPLRSGCPWAWCVTQYPPDNFFFPFLRQLQLLSGTTRRTVTKSRF